MPNTKSLHALSLKPQMSRLFKTRLVILAFALVVTAFTGVPKCCAQPQTSEVQFKLAAGFYERGQWKEASKALGVISSRSTRMPRKHLTPASFWPKR